ncbi:MAG: RIO1 family regulatory kinase/ATPase domain-containing protein [Nitrososphaerales archaeon]
MSSAQVAAKVIKGLEVEDWDVLKAIERSISAYESVPFDRLEKLSELHRDQLRFRLDKLNSIGFVMRSQFGYILNTAGLDAIALNGLVKRNLVSGMGRSIGMGKESDVFEAINDKGERSVIKFYRIGRTSFRSTRKNRSYVSTDSQHQWLTINIHAALKEEEGLGKALKVGVDTPKFMGREKHAVVMSRIDGLMLYSCTIEDIEDPKKTLMQVLENERLSYTKAAMINGDLSEYNILYDGEKPWIIDWPQFVNTDHPNANELLKRDVENSVAFFRRKFGIQIDTEIAAAFVSGKRKTMRLG